MNDPVLASVGDLLADIQDDLEESPSIVNRAVIVCETIDSDGDRWLRIIRDHNVKTWEVRGMLEEVLADLNAYDVVGVMEEEGL